MKKVLNIDIFDEESLYEPYNKQMVSRSLIDYMINVTNSFPKKAEIEVVVNSRVGKKEDCEKLIKDGLKREHNIYLRKYRNNNWLQVIYIIGGVLILLLSMFPDENELIKEVLIIAGWVFIWTACEVEFITDIENRNKRKLINRLLKAKYSIKVKEKKDE